LVERLTFNQDVTGSNPVGRTNSAPENDRLIDLFSGAFLLLVILPENRLVQPPGLGFGV
jgi:hypothetical protein